MSCSTVPCRSAARRAVALISGPSSRKNFSSGATLSSRRQVLVELTDDVKGLGQIYDRLDINPGRARNELVPNGAARMIPWKRRAERERLTASTRLGVSSRLPAGMATDGQTKAASSNPTPQTVLDTLYSLPPSIVFHRRTTSPSAYSIHGSLGVSDIQQRLQDEFGLRAQDVEVTWKDGLGVDNKLRQLGNYDCVITVRGFGQESAPLGVEIVRLLE